MTESLFPDVGADEPGDGRTDVDGLWHHRGWLTAELQHQLVEAARGWAAPPAPMRNIRLPKGGVMSASVTSLGWYWVPYRYETTAVDTDGSAVPPVPDWLAELAASAVADCPGLWPSTYQADAALINWYRPGASMGLHRDAEEPSDAPVVSLSVGDDCVFRMGNATTRTRPWTDLIVRSGDLVVFGGPVRRNFHGVPKLLPERAHPEVDLPPGRLNITLRMTGLSRPESAPTDTESSAP